MIFLSQKNIESGTLLPYLIEKFIIYSVKKCLRALVKSCKNGINCQEPKIANTQKSEFFSKENNDPEEEKNLLNLAIQATIKLGCVELNIILLKFMSDNWEIVKKLNFGSLDHQSDINNYLSKISPF